MVRLATISATVTLLTCGTLAAAQGMQKTLMCKAQVGSGTSQMHITIDGDFFGVTTGDLRNGWELISRGTEIEPGRIWLRALDKDLTLEVDRLTLKILGTRGLGR